MLFTRMMKSISDIVVCGAGDFALRTGLFRWYGRRHSSQLTIVAFSRVVAQAEWEKSANRFHCLPDVTFVRIIEHLSEHAHCLPLEEALDALYAGKPLPAGSVAVTFDDGYAELATLVQPVLAQYNVPATAFLPAAYLDDRDKRFWWDIAEQFLFLATSKTIDTLDQATVEFDLPGFLFAGLSEIVALPVQERRAHIESFIMHKMTMLEREELEKVCDEMSQLKDMGPCRMLTWGQVRVLSGAGMLQFGPHAMDHLSLRGVAVTAARETVLESYKRIADEVGAVVPCYAHAFGELPEHSSPIFSGLPLKYALTGEQGENTAEVHPLLLRRKDAQSLLVHGEFNAGYCSLKLSGVFG